MPKVAVQLLLWNGKNYLEKILAAIGRQTFADLELLVMDNGSTDGTAEATEKLLAAFSRPHRFVKQDRNIGFAGGHNQLFALSQSEYVFLINQDIDLPDDYLEKIIRFMEANAKAAAAEGKLLRANGSIDTAGLKKNWYGKVSDIGGAGVARQDIDQSAEVFGISGALPVYRRAAVLQVSPDGQLFDGTFFSYKEDVDLAWRLKIFGWSAYRVGGAVASHLRGFGQEKKGEAGTAWRQKLSSRNHLLTLVKDLPASEFWQLPFIFVYELGKALYLAVFLPQTLGYLPDFFRLLPNTLKARKVVWSRRRNAA